MLLTRWHLDIKIDKIFRFDSLLGHIGVDETAAGLVGQTSVNDLASASVKPDWSREVVSEVRDRSPLCLFVFLRHDCVFDTLLTS